MPGMWVYVTTFASCRAVLSPDNMLVYSAEGVVSPASASMASAPPIRVVTSETDAFVITATGNLPPYPQSTTTSGCPFSLKDVILPKLSLESTVSRHDSASAVRSACTDGRRRGTPSIVISEYCMVPSITSVLPIY